MTTKDKVKAVISRVFWWRKKILTKVTYWNGYCPLCNQHIGIDVYKDLVTGIHYAKCAACNKEIGSKIEVKD